MPELSFERYLDEVERGLGRRRRAGQRLLRELRGHLRQRFDELCSEGVEPQRALDVLIIEFGEPQELIREYERDYTRSKRIMRTLTATFTAAAAVLAWFFLMPIQPAPQTISTGVPAVQAAGPIAPVLAGVQGATHWMQSTLPFTVTAGANGVPAQVNHQGVVTVNGQRYTGTGHFRFALLDPDSSTNAWTNDGSNVGGAGSPANPVSLSVTDGLYAVRLGDTALPNMVALSPSLFNDDNLKLRVWFDDGDNGPQQLTPDHAMTSSPYAFMAASVADGAITHAKLASAAVTNEKLSPDLDGWIAAGETWTYDSPTSFKVLGDRVLKYDKGTKLRLVQSTTKFFYAINASFDGTYTTVTVAAGDTHQLSNAAMTDNMLSLGANPYGFPAYFSYTPVYTGFVTVPTNVVRFAIQDRMCTIWCPENVGLSNSTTKTMTMPVPINNIGTDMSFLNVLVIDNTTWQTSPGHIRIEMSNRSLMKLGRAGHLLSWTAAGQAGWSFSISYPI